MTIDRILFIIALVSLIVVATLAWTFVFCSAATVNSKELGIEYCTSEYCILKDGTLLSCAKLDNNITYCDTE